MTGRRSLAAWLLLAATPMVLGAQDELDTDLMQSIEDTNKSLASHIALQQGDGARADAQELTAMFAKVEAFYAGKPEAADAVNLAQQSQALGAEILKHLGARDYAAATASATTLSRTCKTCHNFYKKS